MTERKRCAVFLCLSGAEVYGAEHGEPLREEETGQPLDWLGAENAAIFEAEKRSFSPIIGGMALRRCVRIARLFDVYGPNRSANLYYIDDAVGALSNLLLGNHTRPVTIGNFEGISLQASAEQAVRAAGNGGHVRQAKRPETIVLSKPAWGWVPHIEVAKRVMAWCPHVPLEEGIRRTLGSLNKGKIPPQKSLTMALEVC
jgi:nucleoside-diphosphate-sugar epimerase